MCVCVCVTLQVHGRSREQRYTKLADWDYIGTCAEAAAPMPLFGCGDMLSYKDYNTHRQQATGIMIARYMNIIHVLANYYYSTFSPCRLLIIVCVHVHIVYNYMYVDVLWLLSSTCRGALIKPWIFTEIKEQRYTSYCTMFI